MSREIWAEVRRFNREDAAAPIGNRIALAAAFSAAFMGAAFTRAGGPDALSLVMAGVFSVMFFGFVAAGVRMDYLDAQRVVRGRRTP